MRGGLQKARDSRHLGYLSGEIARFFDTALAPPWKCKTGVRKGYSSHLNTVVEAID